MLEIDRKEEPSSVLTSLEAYGQTTGYIDTLRRLISGERRYLRFLSAGKLPSGINGPEDDHLVFRRFLDSYPTYAVDLTDFIDRYSSLHNEQIADHVWKETEYWYGGAFRAGDEL